MRCSTLGSQLYTREQNANAGPGFSSPACGPSLLVATITLVLDPKILEANRERNVGLRLGRGWRASSRLPMQDALVRAHEPLHVRGRIVLLQRDRARATAHALRECSILDQRGERAGECVHVVA